MERLDEAAMTEIHEAKRDVANAHSEPFGELRIAAPIRFASVFVVPAINELLRRYPQIDIDLRTSDRKFDIYEDEVDVAIRIRDLPDSGLRARQLGTMRVVVFGAPEYLARYGRPRDPHELERHQCIVRRTDSEREQWMFRVRGKSIRLRVSGRFSTDDTSAMHEAAAQGLGLGRAPDTSAARSRPGGARA